MIVMTSDKLARVRFATTISKMGERQIIIIPKNYHDEIKGFKKGKQVMVTIDDEL